MKLLASLLQIAGLGMFVGAAAMLSAAAGLLALALVVFIVGVSIEYGR